MMKRLAGSACSSSSSSSSSSTKELKVAIIGAGACGLVAARVLDRSPVGISSVTVLERDDRYGGIWNYIRKRKPNSSTKCNSSSSMTSSDEDNTVDGRMYRPMYRGLRTNLPATIMAYREFPWVDDDHPQPTEEARTEEGQSSFVTHDQILKYLNHYAQTFDLHRLIRYNCSVQRLAIVENDDTRHNTATTTSSSSSTELLPRIELTWKDTTTEVQVSQIFDAVLICNGHYAKPFTPHIDGMEEYFKGHIMHSIQYDDPSIFLNKTVVCVGGGPSGSDLAREISKFAKHVYLSISNYTDMMSNNNNNNNSTRCFLDHASVSPNNNGLFTCDNVTLVPSTVRVDSDSTVLFQSNANDIYKVLNPDVLIFCTGYEYDFPFLNNGSTSSSSSSSSNNLIHQARGKSVSPLYQQLWHARYPNIAFLGLPFSVLPFPLFELQAEAVVSQLLNCAAIPLPPLRERLRIIAEEDSQCSGQPPQDGITSNTRIKDTHYLGKHQWNYCRNMAEISGTYNSHMMKYLTMNQAIYEHSASYRLQSFPGGPDTYRNMRYIRNDQEQKFTVISGQVTQVVSIQ